MSEVKAKVATTGEAKVDEKPEPPKGYQQKVYKTKRGAVPSYHCDSCPHGTLNEAAMQRHVCAHKRGRN